MAGEAVRCSMCDGGCAMSDVSGARGTLRKERKDAEGAKEGKSL